jgi:hypothetical protein
MHERAAHRRSLRGVLLTYPRGVQVALAVLAAAALFIGLPLLVIGLAALGPVGWIIAAVVLPLATLGTILWLGHSRQR